MTHGRYYWFGCKQCIWRGIRYRNLKRCPMCSGKAGRWRLATAKEIEREVAKVKALAVDKQPMG